MASWVGDVSVTDLREGANKYFGRKNMKPYPI
ncbi:hypothetical protein VCSRO97_0050 [Vibrio cholerae]|nr:hypothetical protein VCSRO97_0050 [Vibrio cholerae]